MALTRPQQSPSLDPLLWLAVCFCVGITAESLFDIPLWPAVISTLILACTAFVLRDRQFAAFLVLAGFFALGIVCSQNEKRPDFEPLFSLTTDNRQLITER